MKERKKIKHIYEDFRSTLSLIAMKIKLKKKPCNKIKNVSE